MRAEAIRRLEPERSMQFFVAFLSAAFALIGLIGFQLLVPVVVRWVG